MVFLYQLERGQAVGSYGLNVAALAGLLTTILNLAQAKSKQLQRAVTHAGRRTLADMTDTTRFLSLFSYSSKTDLDSILN